MTPPSPPEPVDGPDSVEPAADGSGTEVPRGSKDAVAAGIWATIAPQVHRPSQA